MSFSGKLFEEVTSSATKLGLTRCSALVVSEFTDNLTPLKYLRNILKKLWSTEPPKYIAYIQFKKFANDKL